MADLPALLKRLEVVTVRLENIASKDGSGSSNHASSSQSNSASSPSLEAFDELISVQVKAYLDLSVKVGGLVNDQALLLKQAFESQKQFLVTAAKSKKPDASVLQSLLKPTSDLLLKISDLKEKNRTSPQINHLSTVAEGVPALGWVAVEPKPGPYVEEMKNAAQFYSNRILKEFKDKDKTQVEWANSFIGILSELFTFIKKYHTTGVAWNPNGEVAKVGSNAPSSAAVAPPPSCAPATANGTSKPTSAPTGALFSELNKGGAITSGLKKVEKSQMTHKNPELRASSVVKAAETAPAPGPQTNASKSVTRGPAKFALEGNRWCIENQDNNKDLVVKDVDPKNIIYIGACNNSTVQIKGKANAVILDGCKKTAVVVESLVSSFDLVNCKSVQCQITGKAPTLAIDKTDGCIVYLSKDCLDIEIFTSKSSELNISIPGKTPNDDFVEMPVPEQFKTVVQNGALLTVPVEHKG